MKADNVGAGEAGEVSRAVGVRTKKPVYEWLKGLGSKRIGKLLERAYEEELGDSA